MSAIEGPQPNVDTALSTFPEFELSYLYDNRDNPTEITVFSSDEDENLATHWITMNATATIPLEDVP